MAQKDIGYWILDTGWTIRDNAKFCVVWFGAVRCNLVQTVILRRSRRILASLPTQSLSLFALSILTILFASISPVFAAETVSSTELIEKCRFYNGKYISYSGEVIGDVMIRGENAWINVNDDIYAREENVEEGSGLKGYNSGQSIWCKASQVRFIEYKGDYNNSGDIVRVEGIFNRACPEHGGDMDIHASSTSLVKTGHSISHSFDIPRALIALVLGALAVVLLIANQFMVRKRTQEQSL